MNTIYLTALTGLLRRTSPVICIVPESEWTGPASAYPGYYEEGIFFHTINQSKELLSGVQFDNKLNGVVLIPQCWLGLVLNDPTGRMHAVWWLLTHDPYVIDCAMKKVLGSTYRKYWFDAWTNEHEVKEHYLRYLREVCLETARIVNESTDC